MFKRSMLVAAMVGLSSGAHAVSLITANAKPNITPQATGAAGVYVQAQEFKVTITDDLDLNGKSMQITFNKALIPALMPTTLTEDDSAAGCDAGAITSVTYAGLTNSNKTANYSFVGDNSKDPGDCIVKVNKMYFAKADLTTSGITAVSSFTLIGSGVSPSISKTVLDLTKDQFKVTVDTAANEKINVNTARKTYVGDTKDTIVFTVGDLAGADTLGGTVTGQEITITGDFSWADDPSTTAFDPTTAGDRATVPVAITGGAAFVAAKSSTSSLVFSDTNNDGAYTLTLTPIVNNNLGDADLTDDVNAVAIPVSTYTVGTKVAYTDVSVDALGADKTLAGSQLVAGVAAGAHALNGASTKVFAVPFGPEVESHNIFVSNSGASAGAITGTLNYAGNTAVDFPLGTANPGVTYLNIVSALAALGEKPAFGRGDISLTVNAPEADITFTAGYTTAAGRANLFMQEQANIATVSNAALTKATAANTAAGCVKTALSEGVDAGAGSIIADSVVTKPATAADSTVKGVAAGSLKFTGTGC
jgi:hypothetical protein